MARTLAVTRPSRRALTNGFFFLSFFFFFWVTFFLLGCEHGRLFQPGQHVVWHCDRVLHCANVPVDVGGAKVSALLRIWQTRLTRKARRYEYHWADGLTVKKAIKCSAPEYVEFLMSWVQTQLDDEAMFPSKIGESACAVCGIVE